MSEKYIADLPSDFPKELLSVGHSLEIVGVSEMAWKHKDALSVIYFLVNGGYAILGGDVYLISNGGFDSTYDSWYINKSTSKSFVKQSGEKAIEYITQYANKNGSGFVYSIVFEKV